jgi:hypothetical protein
MILKQYLSRPVSVQTFPVDQIFSHMKIIEALEVISIPNGEILAYIANKLGIAIDTKRD